MDLFTAVDICSLRTGDLFKFGKDVFFPYRFIERLRTVEGFLLYNIRRSEYTVLHDFHYPPCVYLLTDEEKERVKRYY